MPSLNYGNYKIQISKMESLFYQSLICTVSEQNIWDYSRGKNMIFTVCLRWLNSELHVSISVDKP